MRGGSGRGNGGGSVHCQHRPVGEGLGGLVEGSIDGLDLDVPGGGSRTVRLRLASAKLKDAFGDFEKFKTAVTDSGGFFIFLGLATLFLL